MSTGLDSLFSSILPLHRLSSANLNSASMYNTSPSGVARSHNISENITFLANRNEILCLQETHLRAGDDTAFSRISGTRHWKAFCNHGKDSFQGVATLFSPKIVKHYHIFETKGCPKGHALIHRLYPKSGQGLPFQVVNLYLSATSREERERSSYGQYTR